MLDALRLSTYCGMLSAKLVETAVINVKSPFWRCAST